MTPAPDPDRQPAPEPVRAPIATRPRRRTLLLGFAVGAVALAGGGYAVAQLDNANASTGTGTAGSPGGASGTPSAGFLASDTIHSIDVTIEAAALATMLESYTSTGDKDWVAATVVIDGTSYDQAGMRLKGNSSLRSVTTDSLPQELPWLVRLDEFIDGQNHGGMTELVIRSNSTASALNEALALDLLAEAGLAAQRSTHVALTANGSDPVLRLAVENPDTEWVDRVFATDGVLYKAEAGGDYSYRGDDPSAYTDVFDQETGDDNFAPLTAFLQFINDATDADFAAGLDAELDTESFTTYLAFQALIENSDDIDGPGNNSYLWWDSRDEQMTVVAWDHNMSFGSGFGGGGLRSEGFGGGGAPPVMPGGGPGGGAGGGPGGGGMGGSNILVTRFTALTGQADAVTAATDDLRSTLFTSGLAQTYLDARADLISASGLIDADTLTSEKAQIESYL